MDYKKFIQVIAYAAAAHQEQVRPSARAFRTFPSGERNPYFTHSLWCAMMILLDTQLPERIRLPGAEALLLHDVLEDTNAPLPAGTSDEVRQFVEAMTYPGGFDEEKTAVLGKPPVVQLMKLYDKVATLYDGDIEPQRIRDWTAFTEQLIQTVERTYGELNIVQLARTLVKKYQAPSGGR